MKAIIEEGQTAHNHIFSGTDRKSLDSWPQAVAIHQLPMKTITLILTLFSVLAGIQLSAEQFKALVFADAFDQFHFRNAPVAKEAFGKLGEKHFFEMKFVDTDKDFARETFADYDVIVFVSANPCELDEKTYKPSKESAMGDFHPIAWYHEFEGARVFYTAIGHISDSYLDDVFMQHIYGGMVWAVGKR